MKDVVHLLIFCTAGILVGLFFVWTLILGLL
jgi:hypothetical protein